MPRPTAAHIAYGSATVVCSSLAMLLLSGSPTGMSVAVIGLAALALGVLVALTVPMPHRRATAEAVTGPSQERTGQDAGSGVDAPLISAAGSRPSTRR